MDSWGAVGAAKIYVPLTVGLLQSYIPFLAVPEPSYARLGIPWAWTLSGYTAASIWCQAPFRKPVLLAAKSTGYGTEGASTLPSGPLGGNSTGYGIEGTFFPR